MATAAVETTAVETTAAANLFTQTRPKARPHQGTQKKSLDADVA